MSTKLTAERLREVLHYAPETGDWTWVQVSCKRMKAGDPAGYVRKDGHTQIRIDGVRHLAHRLAWLYVHGVWPADEIDHINGNPSDNRLLNLRECSGSENHQNMGPPKHRPPTALGTTYIAKSGRYLSRIKLNQKQVHIGSFATQEEAHQAYLAAKARLHTFQPTPRGYDNAAT